MFVAEVLHPKVDGGAVRRCCQHHLCHYSGDIQLLLPLYKLSRLFFSCSLLLWLMLFVVLRAIAPLEVLCHSILLLKMFPRTSR